MIPDLRIQVTLGEEERIKRMKSKVDMTSQDFKTVDADLIRRAEEIYSALGLTELNNQESIQDTTSNLCRLVLSH